MAHSDTMGRSYKALPPSQPRLAGVPAGLDTGGGDVAVCIQHPLAAERLLPGPGARVLQAGIVGWAPGLVPEHAGAPPSPGSCPGEMFCFLPLYRGNTQGAACRWAEEHC